MVEKSKTKKIISKDNKVLKFLKNNYIFLCVFVACGAALISYFAIKTYVSNKQPVVTTKANNTYSETLKVATDKNYRPYSYIDEEGNPAGYDIELINNVFNTMEKNIDLQMVEWNEAVDKIVNGEVDIIMTCDIGDVFDTPNQPLKSNITSVDEYIVFSKKEIKDLSTFLDGGIAAGYMDNGNAEDQLRKLGIIDYCVPYASNKDIFDAIERGELEAGVMRNNIAAMLLKDLGYTDIVSRYSIGYSYMCFSVNQSKPELLTEVNKAIRKLSSDGVINSLEDKWLTYFVKPYSFKNIFVNETWLIPVIVSIFIIFVYSIITTRKSNKQLRVIRTLSTDFDIVMLVMVQYEKDSRFKYYKNNGSFDFVLEHSTNKKSFEQYIDNFAKYAVYEDDKEYFNNQINRERVIKELCDSGVYFLNFRGKNLNKIQYYQLKFSSVKDKKGNITNVVVGLHNIDKETRSVLKQKEELEQSQKIAERASRAKTEFLFNMSHDLRTPMNAVLGFTENAKHDLSNPEKLSHELDKIDIAGKSLLDLLNQILEMSRIESGKTELVCKNVDLLKNLEHLSYIFDVNAKEKDIDIQYNFSGIVNRYLFTDYVRLNQIITNIVGNAIKYTPKGGKVSLTISEDPSNNADTSNFKIVVADNGVGISEEFKSKIFESFSRENNSTTANVAGFGLGMSIVKKLIDLFGGTIDIDSKKNEGTTITIVLPIKHGCEEVEVKTTNDEFNLPSLKILLVDDNEMNREIGFDMLNNIGCKVTTANDGDEAVEMVKNSQPGDFDVILMDIQMPNLNGYEATKAIRSLLNKRLANIPIVAVTANAFEEDKKNAFDCGMNGHLVKPLNTSKLKEELRKVLNTKIN